MKTGSIIALSIVGGVLLLGALAFFGFRSLFRHAAEELEPLAVALLRDADEGRVEEAWRRTSPAFQRAVPQERFRLLFEQTRAVMGRFLSTSGVRGVSYKTTTGSPTIGELSLGLVFEKGSTTGSFKFAKEGDDWRLFAFEIPFPPELVAEPD